MAYGFKSKEIKTRVLMCISCALSKAPEATGKTLTPLDTCQLIHGLMQSLSLRVGTAPTANVHLPSHIVQWTSICHELFIALLNSIVYSSLWVCDCGLTGLWGGSTAVVALSIIPRKKYGKFATDLALAMPQSRPSKSINQLTIHVICYSNLFFNPYPIRRICF